MQTCCAMRSALIEWLFPDPPRDFPLRRMTRTVLRAAHILTGGVLLGGYVFSAASSTLSVWWHATLLSGALLLATDLHASCAALVEVRGVVVVAKLGLLLLLPVAGAHAVLVLATVLIIGAISSHLPGRFRHLALLLRDRVTIDTRKG